MEETDPVYGGVDGCDYHSRELGVVLQIYEEIKKDGGKEREKEK